MPRRARTTTGQKDENSSRHGSHPSEPVGWGAPSIGTGVDNCVRAVDNSIERVDNLQRMVCGHSEESGEAGERAVIPGDGEIGRGET